MAWASEHFPAYEPRAVLTALEFAAKRPGVGDTVDAVRAELERMPVEPIA